MRVGYDHCNRRTISNGGNDRGSMRSDYRTRIKDQDAASTGVRIKADVPLSEMFGYIGHLRTMTSGRGQFSMEFSHYMPCPQNVAETVIAEVKERKANA